MPFPLFWAVALSSVAVSLAQPNDLALSGIPALALIGWVPLFWALRRTVSNRQAVALGALFGLLTTLFQDYWLAFFQDYAYWTLLGPALGFAGYGALLGPILRTILKTNRAWTPFAVGALWAVFEFLKGNGFLGFPWGLAPYSLHQWPILFQIIDVTGLSFLTFWIVAFNGWLADLVERPRKFPIGGAAFLSLLAVLTVGYGFWTLGHPLATAKSVRLLLVQQNADPWKTGDDVKPLETSVKQSLLGLRGANVDMVVWSETALRHPLQEWRPYYERNPVESPLFKVIRGSRTWWLFGNPYFQDYNPDKGIRGGVVNATVLMNPQAQIVNYYGKIQQVPFAEYIPFWDVPVVQDFFRNVIGMAGSWDLGRQYTVYQIPIERGTKTVSFSTPICFEDAFPWINSLLVAKGAEVLINLTNDSWSHRDSSQIQHHVAALFRAVENRVPLVRSTNAGVTSVISSSGSLLAGPLPYFEAGHLNVTVDLPAERPLTVYNQWGEWLVMLFAVALILILFIYRHGDRRVLRA